METTTLVNKGRKRENVNRLTFGKVTKFGGHSFNRFENTQLQSWSGI